MKIVITVNTYNPNTDGVQFVTSYLAEGLVRKGHDVTLITTSHCSKKAKNREIINGVLVIRYPVYTKHMIHRGDKQSYRRDIRKLCEKTDCLINVGTQSPFTDWCFKILDDIKCKKILYLHSIWDFKNRKIDYINPEKIIQKTLGNMRWGLYYSKNKKYFLKYNHVIQLHENDYATKLFKEKYGIDSLIIGNAVEDSFFEKNTNGFKKPYDKYFIYVANYSEGKNQEKAIDDFLSSKIDKTIGLVLIGSSKNDYYNKLLNYLKKEEKKRNIGNVMILTGVPREDISKYVINAYAYIMTSKSEKYPISLAESVSAGIPFISNDTGLINEIPGGITVSDWCFSKEIERLCNDEELYKSLSKEGHEFAKKNFRINDKVDKLENIILGRGENE